MVYSRSNSVPSLSSFRISLTNPGRALGQSFLLLISPKLLALSGILHFSINSFQLASLFALLVGLNLSCLIGALVWFIKIIKATRFEFIEVFFKDLFLALYFLSSSMISLLLCILLSAAPWPFGPAPHQSPSWWRPHKELFFDWSAGLSMGVFLSIQANVKPHSSQWILTKLTSSPTSFYSAPASISIPLRLFLGHLQLHSFLFYTCIFTKGQVFPTSQRLTLYLCFLMRPL